jgi:hypothetical protein
MRVQARLYPEGRRQPALTSNRENLGTMSRDEPQLLLPRPPLVDVSGKTNLPTIVYYANEDIYIGDEAIDQCPDESLLHEDFKVALGKHNLSSLVNKQIDRHGRTKRSPLGLTQDFIDSALKHVEKWLARRDQAKPSHIVVAEPIAMGTGEAVNDSGGPETRDHRGAFVR